MKLIIMIIIVAIVNLFQNFFNRPKKNQVSKKNKKVKNTKHIDENINVEEMIKPYMDTSEEEDIIEEVKEVVEDKTHIEKIEEPRLVEVKPRSKRMGKSKSKLNMNRKNIAQGIVWNEILNKPKSLRK
ncbi:MAG: hypothetical protein N4A57_10070 [Anaeromicrobium sp.]|jgi:predicted RND superfamily exporter protein|uniref:hypothetical protein n=1 Tax=Anaeromicrobium sp. TaxID=1929132 RepID=UPI0025F1B0BA|nr:hypothetical protein [Anaeromicrobium sp.]MCT4594595.1 hypothetical protein [Anaeromicrobium sp.]